jgi:hypothetical protein
MDATSSARFKLRSRKSLLATGIGCFVLSAIVRIDTTLIRAIFGIPEAYDPLIQKIASGFGALGGILVAAYYVVGFLQDRRNSKKEISDET